MRKLTKRWDNDEYEDIDFSSSPFEFTDENKIDFRGIVTKSHLHKRIFQNIDFSYSKVDSFLACTIKQCMFVKSQFGGSIGNYFENCHFVNCNVKNLMFIGEFNNVAFINCKFNKAHFEGVKLFKECKFINCTFKDLSSIQVNFENVSFEDCKFIDTTFSKSKFTNVNFTDCKYEDYFCISFSKFKDSSIDHAELKKAAMYIDDHVKQE